jgi:hypothetical protein
MVTRSLHFDLSSNSLPSSSFHLYLSNSLRLLDLQNCLLAGLGWHESWNMWVGKSLSRQTLKQTVVVYTREAESNVLPLDLFVEFLLLGVGNEVNFPYIPSHQNSPSAAVNGTTYSR